MPKPSFWTRLREARLIPVLLLYLGASWIIILLVNVLQERMGLPSWMDPAALILLIMGLIIIAATGWVLSNPRIRERKAAGNLPGNWEIAPHALLGELLARGVPHLTWARSILGGIFALGLMFALAALLALLAGPSEGGQDTPPSGPAESVGEPVPGGPPGLPGEDSR
jgi:TRAP-type C4-dicarboxylate transport system permease small subunit